MSEHPDERGNSQIPNNRDFNLNLNRDRDRRAVTMTVTSESS